MQQATKQAPRRCTREEDVLLHRQKAGMLPSSPELLTISLKHTTFHFTKQQRSYLSSTSVTYFQREGEKEEIRHSSEALKKKRACCIFSIIDGITDAHQIPQDSMEEWNWKMLFTQQVSNTQPRPLSKKCDYQLHLTTSEKHAHI